MTKHPHTQSTEFPMLYSRFSISYLFYPYWVDQKVCSIFTVTIALVAVVFNFIQNNFVRLYCDGCRISLYF